MVAKAKVRFATEEERVQFLSRRGGRSVVAALAGPGICLTVLIGVFIVVSPSDFGERIDTGNNCEVFYSGDATVADAQRLSTVLTDSGLCDGANVASVRIERIAGQGLTIGFVVIEGAWNDLKTVHYFEQLGSIIAEAGFGRPLTITLCNEYFEPRESVLVKS